MTKFQSSRDGGHSTEFPSPSSTYSSAHVVSAPYNADFSKPSPLSELAAWRELADLCVGFKNSPSTDTLLDIESKLESVREQIDGVIDRMAALNSDLRMAEIKYRSMVQHAVVGIIETLPNGKLMSGNLAIANMLGYSSPQQLLSEVQDVAQQFYKNQQARREWMEAIERDGFVTNFKTEWKKRDGTIIWVEYSTRGIRDESGRMIGYETTIQDITARVDSKIAMIQAYDETIEGWARALDLRDKETEGHTRRVTDEVVRLAQALGLGNEEILHIRRGALLHDIGKMGIPDGILLKPGPLTDEEWTIMRKHPDYAFQVLSPIAYLRPALDIPQYHHEKWDGSGYPQGLRGEDIPLAARIFAVVDVWDALISDRPYRPGWPTDKVIAELERGSGTHFDPAIVPVFLDILRNQSNPVEG